MMKTTFSKSIFKMNRRQAIKILSSGIAYVSIPNEVFAALRLLSSKSPHKEYDSHVRDYLFKIKNFDETNVQDLFLNKSKIPILKSSVNRFRKIQKLVGYGNFGLISMDDAIKTARQYSSVGPFRKKEIDFIEMIFYKDSSVYGFLGEKPLKNFTARLKTKKIVKISGSGHYLYEGKSLEKYNKIKKTIGDDVVLTSGLRSIPKQIALFLNKTIITDANLSKASRSLAPPGYSLHGIGDFDVGQKRFGVSNFSIEFTKTPVYEKLIKSGFADFRYTENNNFGVRFEPWHIKV